MESLFCIWFGWCWNRIKWVILCYFKMTVEVLWPSWETGDESKSVAKTKGSALNLDPLIPEALSDITRRSASNIYEWVFNVWDCARGTSSITQTPGISVCWDCEKTDRSIYHFPVNQAASLMSAGLLASGSGCNRNLLWWWNHRVSCPFSTLKELRAFVVL